MRFRLPLLVVLAVGIASIGYPKENGYIDYTVTVTGAQLLKTHVRADLSCHVLTQFGLKDEHGRLFGFQFDGETPCGEQPWKVERWMYDQNALTEVYVGVSGDTEVPGFDKAQFANNKKAHSSVELRADATGTIVFENLENTHQEFVSGTIEFKYVK